MTKETIKSDPSDRNNLFDLARQIYALHSAINQLAQVPTRRNYREKLIKQLNIRAQEFDSCGGIIETGVDMFGEKGPILSYPDNKEVIPYSIGRLDCERLLNF